MKKRGISPLIATVLLIGFVVAVAAIVMVWGKGFIQERAEKEGALSEAQIQCNLVQIELDEQDNIVNVGSVRIGGFIIRRKTSGVDEKKDATDALEVLGSKYYDLDDEDEIIPCIKPEGAGAPLVPCSDKSIKLRKRS